MDRCPPEVLIPIFRRACTDGGFTARSLALTSRYINSVSSACRFHTVAATGPRIPSLAAALDAPPAAPTVRHLFLSTLVHEATLHVRPDRDGTITPALIPLKKAMLRILLLCGPALESLALLTHLFTLAQLPAPLPALRALTTRAPPAPAPPPPEALAPALTHLHLIEARPSHDLAALAPLLAGARLQRLRFSDVRDGILGDALTHTVRLADGQERTRRTRALFEPLLRELRLLSLQSLGGVTWPMLNRRTRLRGGELEVSCLQAASRPYEENAAFDDWLAYANGDEGAWTG